MADYCKKLENQLFLNYIRSDYFFIIISFIAYSETSIMARPTVIKHTKTKRKSSTVLPFIPEVLQAFVARRFVDGVAFVFFAAGLFLSLALASYHHTDSSFNSASVGDIQNMMGVYGAYTADLFLQTIGISTFLIGFCFMIWGVRSYKRQKLSMPVLRFMALLTMPILGAVAMAQIPSGGFLTHPYMGASAGTIILEKIHALPFFSASILPGFIISAVMGIACMACFVFVAGFKKETLKYTALRLASFGMGVVLFSVYSVQRFASWVAHYNDPADFEKPRREPFKWPFFSLKRDVDEPASDTTKLNKVETQKVPQTAVDAPSEPKKAPTIPVVAKPAKAEKVASEPTIKPAVNQQRFALNENGEWEFPPMEILQDVPEDQQEQVLSEDALRKNAELLQNVLNDFNIQGDIVSIHPGPVVTLYEFEPAPGTKSSRIISLADDIARSMSAISVRCAVVPGRNVIGIELPNKKRQFVFMKEILESREVQKSKAHLPLILGKDIGGQPIMADLAKMPHLLVAGTTGSGKSVAVNTMILSLLYRMSPEKCRFIMIDPKMLELSVYDDIPHLLSPVVTEPGKAVVALKWTVAEMENRYRSMSKLGVRNIEGYNERLRDAAKKGETIMHKVQTGFDPETGEATYEDQPMDLTELPYIVVVVDEFADLMLVAGKDVENAIQRLAQMARAAGIHLIMATQRPSVDVITGVIKANFPTRISFQVTSKIDSRTILGDAGAEQLLGMGDMLYMAPGGRITRVHGPFVSDDEVEQVVNFLKSQGEPAYLNDVTDEGSDFGSTSEIMNAIFDDRTGGGDEKVDELYDQAVAVVAREGKVSTSFIQRHLQIGYNRAARIVEEMEKQGIISPASPTGKRDILVSDWSSVT